MKRIAGILILSGLAFSAEPASPVAKLYDGQVSMVEREIVSLAEAMPADKYNFAPTGGEFKGVRTFAQQAKHVAAVNYICAAAVLGEKPPVDTGGEDGPASVKTKDEIVKFLKDSFALAHRAALSLTEKNQVEQIQSPFGQNKVMRGGPASCPVWHSFDHYGQMVVYARMNGIIPPASRQ